LNHALAAALVLACLVLAAPLHAADGPGVVNVNKASAEQLQLLPRIGPVVAQRIIAFRDENGALKSTEELMLVRGIGERTFEGLEAYVTLTGETTLQEKVHPPRREKSADEAAD
jgi:competence ComEA-like helix-hairpin-helix protein